jgi:hypothetical protein
MNQKRGIYPKRRIRTPKIRTWNQGNRRFGVHGRLPGGNGVMGGYYWVEAFEHYDNGDNQPAVGPNLPEM